jgi:alanyl-tRNA synthetase
VTRVPDYLHHPFTAALIVEVVDAGVDHGSAWVVTDRTIVYPGGGGQPADEATLGGARVTAVSRTPRGWRHSLDAPAPPVTSGRVGIGLDWPRRFDHMQQHTAQHLLSALAQDRWDWATTAFHLGSGRSDIELSAPSLTPDDLERIEEAAMAVVRDSLPVTTRWVGAEEYRSMGTRSRGLPDGHEGDVRLVEIGDVDVTACGGTHLASTAQIESIKLLEIESMRGGTRLHWVAGGRVRARLGEHQARSEGLRRLLGVPDEELVDQAEAKLEQLRESERRARWLEGLLADEAAARIASDPASALDAHFEGLDASFLRAVAQRLQERLGTRTALLTSEAGGAAAFVLVAGAEAAVDVRALGAAVAERLEGRGGGAGQLFQGRAGSLAGRDRALSALTERRAAD